MRKLSLLACLAMPLLASAVPASSLLAAHADLRSVAGMKTHDRVLLVFAPSLRDPRLEQERQMMARFSLGAAERDLVLVQIGDGKVLGAHDREDQLRRKYRTPVQRYRVVLLGKDGSVSLDSAVPVDEHRLQATIDAMPMRQQEIHKAQAGHPLPKSG
jgi:hypothetical protein